MARSWSSAGRRCSAWARPWSRRHPAAGSLLQATVAGEETIAAHVLAALPRAKRVADLFAGCGLFALRLAKRAKVHAVESDKVAVLALTRAVGRRCVRMMPKLPGVPSLSNRLAVLGQEPGRHVNSEY